MAEEKPAAWYEKQIDQYKAELDELNPKLNVANARIVELDATVVLLQGELRAAGEDRLRLLGQINSTEDAFRAFAQASHSEIKLRDLRIQFLENDNEALRSMTAPAATEKAAE